MRVRAPGWLGCANRHKQHRARQPTYERSQRRHSYLASVPCGSIAKIMRSEHEEKAEDGPERGPHREAPVNLDAPRNGHGNRLKGPQKPIKKSLGARRRGGWGCHRLVNEVKGQGN